MPLWWDAGTLADLAAWKAYRLHQGTEYNAPFVPNGGGTRLSRHTLRKRFRTACKVLGRERLESLTIHHGRHTFISHALAGGSTLAEVRDAAGHANVLVRVRCRGTSVRSSRVNAYAAAWRAWGGDGKGGAGALAEG